MYAKRNSTSKPRLVDLKQGGNRINDLSGTMKEGKDSHPRKAKNHAYREHAAGIAIILHYILVLLYDLAIVIILQFI